MAGITSSFRSSTRPAPAVASAAAWAPRPLHGGARFRLRAFHRPGALAAIQGLNQKVEDAVKVKDAKIKELEERLARSLAELNLSVRATNCLESEGINTVRDLVIRTDDQLLQVRNFGDTTLQEVRERLLTIGLRLGMRVAPQTGSSAAK